jgi:hypothetical protein
VHALGSVQIGVRVEIEKPGRPSTLDMPRDGADPDRAVAAEHQRRLAVRYRRGHSVSGLPDDLYDGSQVLVAWILSVRPPAPDLAIAAIADVDPGTSEQLEQPCVAERRRRELLSRREGARACGNSEHCEWLPAHRSEPTSTPGVEMAPGGIEPACKPAPFSQPWGTHGGTLRQLEA